MLVGLDAAAEFEQRQPRVRVVRLQHVVRQIRVRHAERRRDLQQRAVLERLVGLPHVGRRGGLHLFARLEHGDLPGLQIDRALVVLVASFDGIERLGRRRRRDEQRVHRGDLLPVELRVVILVEQEELHDAGGEARHAAQLPGVDRVDDVHDLEGRHANDLAGKRQDP